MPDETKSHEEFAAEVRETFDDFLLAQGYTFHSAEQVNRYISNLIYHGPKAALCFIFRERDWEINCYISHLEEDASGKKRATGWRYYSTYLEVVVGDAAMRILRDPGDRPIGEIPSAPERVEKLASEIKPHFNAIMDAFFRGPPPGRVRSAFV